MKRKLILVASFLILAGASFKPIYNYVERTMTGIRTRYPEWQSYNQFGLPKEKFKNEKEMYIDNMDFFEVMTSDSLNRCYMPEPSLNLDNEYIVTIISKFSTLNETHFQLEDVKGKAISDVQRIPSNNMLRIGIDSIPKETITFGVRLGTIESDGSFNPQGMYTFMAYDFQKELALVTENLKSKLAIEKFARKYVSPNDSDFEKIKKIYDFCIDDSEYTYSWTREGSIKELRNCLNFKRMKIECGEYSDFMRVALRALGMEAYEICDDKNGHIWLMVKLDDKWYHLDPTYSDQSSWEKTSRYRGFLVSDDFMRKEGRFFIRNFDNPCEETYDLTGLVSEKDVAYRGFKGELVEPLMLKTNQTTAAKVINKIINKVK